MRLNKISDKLLKCTSQLGKILSYIVFQSCFFLQTLQGGVFTSLSSPAFNTNLFDKKIGALQDQ